MKERLLSKKLKEIREKKLILQQVSQLTGLSKGYLSQIENSDDRPPIYTLSKISGRLASTFRNSLPEHL